VSWALERRRGRPRPLQGINLRRPAARPAAAASRLARPRAERRETSPMPGSYVLLVALVIVLNLVGLVMVLSASTVGSLRAYGSPWYFFERQLLWVMLGGAALVVSTRTDYRRWRRFSRLGLATVIVLLMAVLVPGVGVMVSGSRRWLGLGGWRVQPSEFAKLALILYLADLLARRGARMRQAGYTTFPVMVALVVLAGLVMREPDMGTTMVLVAVTFAVLWVAGAPLGIIGLLTATAAGAGFAMAVAAPYRWARLTAFLHPFADAGNTGYQSAQALVSLGTGKLSGVGLGASRASWGFLPNPHTDFIFAIIGEELGLVGTLVVVGLFAAFTVLGVRAALRAPDRFGSLAAAGITAWIVGEAIINVGAVVGLLPVTGVPLPFISFGGSSLVIAMFATGILLNVARQGS
jgi:cell division protein FtsW